MNQYGGEFECHYKDTTNYITLHESINTVIFVVLYIKIYNIKYVKYVSENKTIRWEFLKPVNICCGCVSCTTAPAPARFHAWEDLKLLKDFLFFNLWNTMILIESKINELSKKKKINSCNTSTYYVNHLITWCKFSSSLSKL